MTEQQEQELYNFIRKTHGVILMGDDFVAIRSILSATSEAAETGGAEEVWNIAEGILDKCRCEPIYANRKMVDPNCAWCEYHVDFIQAMTTYAAQRCADKDMEIKELRQQYHTSERHRLEDAASAIADQGFQYDRIKYLQSELSEAKKRIKELEEQSKESLKLNSEFYKCNVCGNTPTVIVFTDKGTFCKEHANFK